MKSATDHSRTWLPLILCVVLALAMAACGEGAASDDAAGASDDGDAAADDASADDSADDAEEEADDDAAGDAAAAGEGLSPDDPIVVGISGPTSGETAIYAPLPLSTEAYLNYVNDQGGINGYTFDVQVLNNSSTAAGGASTVRQLMNQDPFALVVNGSPVYAAAISAVREIDPTVPVFVTASATVIREVDYEQGFGMNPPYEDECAYQVQYAQDVLGAENIAIAWQDDGVGQGVGRDCVAFAEEQGLTVTSIGVPPDTTDFGSFAARIVESGAEVTLGYMFTAPFVGLQTAADAVGYDGDWMTFSTNDLAYAELAGDLAEGVYVTQFLTPPTVETDASALFNEEIVPRVGEEAVGSLGAMGWTVGAIITHAIETATADGQALTREAFIEAVNGIDGAALGMAPEVSYVDDRTTIVSALPLYQFQDGELVEVQEPTALPER